jgi:hypothetical protein
MAGMVLAAPAMACDLDYLPDFAGHSYRVGMDPDEVARAREEAMANARAAFIRQYGLATQSTAPAATTEVADASAATPAPEPR